MFGNIFTDPYFCLKDHGNSEKSILMKTNIIMVILRPAILEYLESLGPKFDKKENRDLVREFISFYQEKLKNIADQNNKGE